MLEKIPMKKYELLAFIIGIVTRFLVEAKEAKTCLTDNIKLSFDRKPVYSSLRIEVNELETQKIRTLQLTRPSMILHKKKCALGGYRIFMPGRSCKLR